MARSDVTVDNVSIGANYRNQFNRVINDQVSRRCWQLSSTSNKASKMNSEGLPDEGLNGVEVLNVDSETTWRLRYYRAMLIPGIALGWPALFNRIGQFHASDFAQHQHTVRPGIRHQMIQA